MPITWILNNMIAASPIAKSIEDVEQWERAGVKAIVILAETQEIVRYWGSLSNYFNVLNAKGFEYTHSPIKDFHAPNLNQLENLIEWIDSRVKENRPVLIHCRAGIGRTSTIIAAYLIKKGYEVNDAIMTVRKRIPLALEVDEQISIVYKYYETLMSR
ncbi:MAG: dual specificity protein phosphatase family protein [Nitrososphaerota archaeon]|nr:dual specificity protein phosphatase family protein [Nitrososphaerota archaeon]